MFAMRLGADFLAGFLEAEAHFGLTRQNRGTTWSCAMAVTLRDDDAALLEHCQREFKLGRLTPVPARRTSKPQLAWVVVRKADVRRLADLLESRLRGHKALV